MKNKILPMLAAISILLAACKERGYQSVSAAADSAKVDTVANGSAGLKLVKTAEMQFKVKNVQQTAESISNLVRARNGMVMHHIVSSENLQSRDIELSSDSVKRVTSFMVSAQMTVRVPSEGLEEFMNAVSHMSTYVNVRKMDVDDRTLDYLSDQMKLKNRDEFVAAQKQHKVVLKDPSSVIDLKDDMVDKAIANLRTDQGVKLSTVELSFSQPDAIRIETIANTNPSAYDLPFFRKAALAFANGWYIFYQLVIGLINLWVLVVFGLLIWWMVRVWLRKKHPKHVAPNI